MTTNPTSFRLPLNIEGKAAPEVVEAMQWHDDAINDLQQSIPEIKSQITALQTASTSSSKTTTENVSSSSETTIVQPNTLGMVNNQSGNTACTTQQSDYGAFLIFNDASAVAVTLGTGTGIQLPFFCTVINYGVGTATLTPQSGTISYAGNVSAASLPVPQNAAAALVFDGANFFAVLFPAPPAGISATIVTAALTPSGTQGSQTFTNGLLTAQTPAT